MRPIHLLVIVSTRVTKNCAMHGHSMAIAKIHV